MTDLDESQVRDLEAAAFRKLLNHLRERTDVQNIDMMNLTGFCRNCLSRWYQEAATQSGLEIGKEEAREHIYGMPYDQWRDRYQSEATPAQRQKFQAHDEE